jgi:hypothetical protein
MVAVVWLAVAWFGLLACSSRLVGGSEHSRFVGFSFGRELLEPSDFSGTVSSERPSDFSGESSPNPASFVSCPVRERPQIRVAGAFARLSHHCVSCEVFERPPGRGRWNSQCAR